jgi:hypothetical protein
VIILDLQHIKSATETEVQGGCWRCWRPRGGKSGGHNVARAEAGAQAFGNNTITSTTTDTLAIQGQFSGSSSNSFAAAS